MPEVFAQQDGFRARIVEDAKVIAVAVAIPLGFCAVVGVEGTAKLVKKVTDSNIYESVRRETGMLMHTIKAGLNG